VQEEQDDETNAEGTILERSKNIVQHHLVFKWTSLAPGDKFSPTVGALNLSELHPSLIRNSIHSVIVACYNAGLGVCNVTGDGAGENVKVFTEMSKVDCLQYIDPETIAKFPGIEFEAEKWLAMEHPVTHDPVFVLEDMPHVVKRIVNALEMSSNPRSKRKLRYAGNPLNLWMIQNCWEAMDGRSLRMQDTKFTMRHFHKDAFTRMKVYLSTQVMSGSTVQMFRRALADDETEARMHYDRWQYTKIIELAAHVNNLVDIINGRGKKTVATAAPVDAAPVTGNNSGDADGQVDNYQYTSHFVPENATEIQEELLGILEWFYLWRASAIRKGKEKEQFLSDPTWRGIKRMILGYVGMLGYYVKRQQYSIVPRRTLSDPCEHHFANSRANVGSTNNPNVMQQNAVTNRCEMYTSARHELRGSKGNSSHAPFEPHTRNSQY
jgi:hypothetical protein